MSDGIEVSCVYALVGAGGFGSEVMPEFVRAVERSRKVLGDEFAYSIGLNYSVVFASEYDGDLKRRPLGYQVVSLDWLIGFARTPGRKVFFNVAIGDARTRERLGVNLVGAGAHPLEVRAAHSYVPENTDRGEGAIFCPQALAYETARIGRFFHANVGAIVCHDCIVGDFVTLAPRVNLLGNVTVDDRAYIGTAATVLPGCSIGAGAIVGAGAVVTKDVPAGVTVTGIPARIKQ